MYGIIFQYIISTTGSNYTNIIYNLSAITHTLHIPLGYILYTKITGILAYVAVTPYIHVYDH